MRTKTGKFGREYFSGYYYRNVGNFTLKDLNKARNWFSGWLSYLQKFIDLKNGRGKRVLEIGCSIGGASNLLYDAGFDVHASDISSFVIKRAKNLAREQKKDINFYIFDVEKGIPVDGNFNLIIAFEVIEHLKDPLNAITNMRSKLKKKGILVCSTPNKDYDRSSDPTHINVKSKEEWGKIFHSVGFNNIKIRQVSFLPFFYKLSKRFHLTFPIAIKSKFINSPLFIIAVK